VDKAVVDAEAPAAWGRRHQVMTIYPAFVGDAYLKLEEATGDKKYFDAALKIAEFYKNTVLENFRSSVFVLNKMNCFSLL
jgi:hypothetical protein